MTDNSAAPPASALVCMFADRLVPLDDWKSAGTPVPGHDVKVKTLALASHVFALSLWQLAQEGLVSLRHEEKKRLGIRTTKVQVKMIGTSPKRAGVIEDRLLTVLSDGGEHDAKDVVYDAIGEDQTHPSSYVVQLAEFDGVPGGYYADVDAGRGAVGRTLLGATRRGPVLPRFPDAAPAFERLAESWTAFCRAEPVLAPALLRKCEKAINGRTEAADD